MRSTEGYNNSEHTEKYDFERLHSHNQLGTSIQRAAATAIRSISVLSLHTDLVSKDALPALALEDRVTLAKAIPHLRDTTRKSLHEFAYFPTRDDINQCNNPVICRALIAKATRASEELMFHCIWRYGALWPSLKCNGICESCLARWKKSYKKGLEAVWADLPSYFNLPPWKYLRAQSPLSTDTSCTD